MKPKTLSLLLLRVLLGAAFAASGFQKLVSPWQNFAAVIEQYDLLKGVSAVWLAQIMPWLEFIAGVFFLVGLWRRTSLLLLWAMNTLFIGVLASAILRKLPIDSCGCFGQAVVMPMPAMLFVDVLFWAGFLAYFMMTRRTADEPALDTAFGLRGRR